MEKVRLGVIGYGNMGSSHCKKIMTGLVPSMELTAICDTNEARRTAAKDNYPDVVIFDNVTELYKSGLCDVVIVATPHYDHPRLVGIYLRASCHYGKAGRSIYKTSSRNE